MQKTVENLAKAFVGESQARNRYSIFAQKAREEGFEQIGAVFEETADQEREHATWLFGMLCDLAGQEKMGEIEIGAEVPFVCGTTLENLEQAIKGENYEHSRMYPEFAELAQKEGFSAVAAKLRAIATAEIHHEERYEKIRQSLAKGEIFKKDQERVWVCRKCGYMHKGKEAPGGCPSCGKPRAFFQLQCEEY